MNSPAARIRLGLVLRLLAGACAALAVTAGAAPKPTLAGRLVDVEGKPIAGAKLTFEASEYRIVLPGVVYGPTYRSESTVSAKTDVLGVFRLPFSKEHLRLLSLENTGHWLEPNQGLASTWRAVRVLAPGSVSGPGQVFHGTETDIGDVLAYPFPGSDELAHVKETPAVTTVIHDEQTINHDWKAGAFDPPNVTGPRLSIALRLFQEPGAPAQVRLTFRGVQAEL